MKDLETLRRLLVANGVIAPGRDQAGSMEIIPFLEDLVEITPVFTDKPPPEPQEGGGCSTCSAGCNTGCPMGCPSGCLDACVNGCFTGDVM